MFFGTKKNTIGALAGLASAVASLAVAAPLASADEFMPGNNVSGVNPNTGTAVAPDNGVADTQDVISVTVSDADTLNDLSSITVCLYHTGYGDSACPVNNGRNEMKFTWTRTGDNAGEFSQAGGATGAYWREFGSLDPASFATTSGEFGFAYKAAEYMTEGVWNAKVTVDDNSQSTVNTGNGFVVSWYGEADVPETTASYGTVASGASGGSDQSTSYTVIANGVANETLTAPETMYAWEGNAAYTFAVQATTGAPSSGSYALVCDNDEDGSTAGDTALAAAGAATTLDAIVTATGTGESGESQAAVCDLKHGGGQPVGDYSGSVTLGVADG